MTTIEAQKKTPEKYKKYFLPRQIKRSKILLGLEINGRKGRRKCLDHYGCLSSG
jgi:hypothetical protein